MVRSGAPGRDADDYAAATRTILDSPAKADELSRQAAAAAAAYTWTTMAARLRRVYDDIGARVPVDCLG